MHILVLGAAGMVGRKLTERLARDGRLGNREITRLTLQDVVAPQIAHHAGRHSLLADRGMDRPQHHLLRQPSQRRLLQRADAPHQPVLLAQPGHVEITGRLVWRHGRLRDSLCERFVWC